MTKAIKTVEDVKLPEDNSKAEMTFVKAAIVAYGAAKIRVHVAAVVALMRAASADGNTKLLDTLYAGLPDKKERDKFRKWLSSKTAVTISGKKSSWLTFSTEKGTHGLRKGFVEERKALSRDALLSGDRFYAMDKPERTESEKEKLFFEYFGKLESNVSRKATDAGIDLPEEILSKIREVASLVKAWDAERAFVPVAEAA